MRLEWLDSKDFKKQKKRYLRKQKARKQRVNQKQIQQSLCGGEDKIEKRKSRQNFNAGPSEQGVKKNACVKAIRSSSSSFSFSPPPSSPYFKNHLNKTPPFTALSHSPHFPTTPTSHVQKWEIPSHSQHPKTRTQPAGREAEKITWCRITTSWLAD